MTELTTKRTLVKSPPELWAEVSDLEALAGHLGEFGEIRITRLELETTVVWEGDRACGTVKLEPSGWGTRVTLTAAIEVAQEPEPEPEPAPEPAPSSGPEPRPGFWARLFGRRRPVAAATAQTPGEPPPPARAEEPDPEPAPVDDPPHLQPVPDPEPEPAADDPLPAAHLDENRAVAVLTEVLDKLGAAHHRPFSRG